MGCFQQVFESSKAIDANVRKDHLDVYHDPCHVYRGWIVLLGEFQKQCVFILNRTTRILTFSNTLMLG
jgi:hypothetical protein